MCSGKCQFGSSLNIKHTVTNSNCVKGCLLVEITAAGIEDLVGVVSMGVPVKMIDIYYFECIQLINFYVLVLV